MIPNNLDPYQPILKNASKKVSLIIYNMKFPEKVKLKQRVMLTFPYHM